MCHVTFLFLWQTFTMYTSAGTRLWSARFSLDGVGISPFTTSKKGLTCKTDYSHMATKYVEVFAILYMYFHPSCSQWNWSFSNNNWSFSFCIAVDRLCHFKPKWRLCLFVYLHTDILYFRHKFTQGSVLRHFSHLVHERNLWKTDLDNHFCQHYRKKTHV